MGYFNPELFEFLRELRNNNNKSWFTANKRRYEETVKEPFLSFISDFWPHLNTISQNFEANSGPVGGSMFRIYRDTRFSKDKSPYKTNVAAHFYHQSSGSDVHGIGFYLHLEPENSMGGGGLWHPAASVLANVRDRIVSHAKEWKLIREKGIVVEGDTLKRPPQGYDGAHPFIEDIKHKDFYSMVKFSEQEVCAPDFMDRYIEACRYIAPLMKFLTLATNLSW